MTPRRVGIFGGSFNPVHRGHTGLASYIAHTPLVDEVWLTLSPSNPLKPDNSLSEHHRLAMLQMATIQADNIKVCDIELSMPRPSYTIDTLDRLAHTYPDCKFTLITGADNLAIFDRWRDYRRIISDYGLIVYPRPDYSPGDMITDSNIIMLDSVPMFDISSTILRDNIADPAFTQQYLDPEVYKYIQKHHLYQ